MLSRLQRDEPVTVRGQGSLTLNGTMEPSTTNRSDVEVDAGVTRMDPLCTMGKQFWIVSRLHVHPSGQR